MALSLPAFSNSSTPCSTDTARSAPWSPKLPDLASRPARAKHTHFALHKARVGDHEFLQILGEGAVPPVGPVSGRNGRVGKVLSFRDFRGTHGRVYKVADPVVGGFNAVKVIRPDVVSFCDTKVQK